LESDPFIEAQEAYDVLADPERRRRYDRDLHQLAISRHQGRITPEPLVRERPKAEPLRPVEASSSFRDISLAESFEAYRPSFDEIFNRWWSNFESVIRPKSETLESLTVEVIISPDEARRGGRIRVRIPARSTCRYCGGYGAVGRYECWRCEGQGAFTTEYPMELEYPPGIRDGYAMRIPLVRYGIENLYLAVLIRVTGRGP
jgi:DnaJ-class molecular chaperone